MVSGGRGTKMHFPPMPVNVWYTTYAAFPATGLRVGYDFAFATDRLVFYYWNGAAWVALTVHSSAGLAADIPTAGNLPNGSFYFETDTLKAKRVVAGAWVTTLDPSSYGTASMTIAETEVFSGNTPGASAWTDLDINAVVGSNVALVMLKVNGADGIARVAVRKNGDTDEFWNNGPIPLGAACGEVAAAQWVVLVVLTDAAGILEWKAEGLAKACTIDVMAYIN